MLELDAVPSLQQSHLSALELDAVPSLQQSHLSALEFSFRRNHPPVPDRVSFCPTSAAEVPVAMATQHGTGGPLAPCDQSPDQLPVPPLRQSAAGCHVAPTEGGGVGVHTGHGDGAQQPLLHHCQGERLWSCETALEKLFFITVRERDCGPVRSRITEYLLGVPIIPL